MSLIGGDPWLTGKLLAVGISCIVGIYSPAGDCAPLLTGTPSTDIEGGVLVPLFNFSPHFPQNAALSGL